MGWAGWIKVLLEVSAILAPWGVNKAIPHLPHNHILSPLGDITFHLGGFYRFRWEAECQALRAILPHFSNTSTPMEDP